MKKLKNIRNFIQEISLIIFFICLFYFSLFLAFKSVFSIIALKIENDTNYPDRITPPGKIETTEWSYEQ